MRATSRVPCACLSTCSSTTCLWRSPPGGSGTKALLDDTASLPVGYACIFIKLIFMPAVSTLRYAWVLFRCSQYAPLHLQQQAVKEAGAERASAPCGVRR